MAAKYRRWTPEVVRARIKAGMLVKALIDHTLGNREMVPSQVTAGLGLLKKVIPDLSAMDIKSVATNDIRELETAELHRRISALEGAVSPPRSIDIAPEVH